MSTKLYNGTAADHNIATAGNWAGGVAPVSGDGIVFPAMASAAGVNINGSDLSAVLLASTVIEAGCYVAFGSRTAYLHLDTDYLTYQGQAYAFLQIDNSTEVRLYNGVNAGSGYSFGMQIIGANNALLVIDTANGNSVGVAAGGGETAGFTTVDIHSGSVTIGSGATVTTLAVSGGVVECACNSTTLSVDGGNHTQESGHPTTLNINGGRVYYNSTDAPTTINCNGGVLDFSSDGRAKAWAGTTINLQGGTVYDPGNVLSGFTLGKKGGTLQNS